MMKKNIFLLLMFLSFYCTLIAEVDQGTFDLSPFYGYNYFQKKQNLKNNPLYGGRFAYNIVSYVGLETSFSFIKTRVRDSDISLSKEGQFVSFVAPDAVSAKFYSLDLVYNIVPSWRVTPYVFLGYGATSYNPSIQTKDLSSVDSGLGLKISLSKVVSLRFEGRDIFVSEKFKNGYHNVSATFGIQITLNSPVSVQIVEKEVAKQEVSIGKSEKVLESHVFHFTFGKVKLNPLAKKALNKLSFKMHANPKLRVRITGFSSSYGLKEFNMRLRFKRAEIVKKYLINKGIAPGRLLIRSYESTQSAVKEWNRYAVRSPEALANMRVLVEVLE